MKSLMTIALLAFSLSGFAESLHDIKVKKEMLDRVDSLIEKTVEGREALSKKDSATACLKIIEMFQILPQHLVAIGTKMNLLNGKIIKMEQESKMLLIDMHQRKNICEQGTDYLDIQDTSKKLKSMKKALEKQRARIKKSDTDYQNVYNYHYQF